MPFLGDIPLLGVLFQQNDDREERRDAVVVVRPWVLSTPAESEAVSARLLDSFDVDRRHARRPRRRQRAGHEVPRARPARRTSLI